MSMLPTPKLNILLIDSDEVIHLLWSKGTLRFHESYSVDQDSYDRFHVFLEGDAKTPFVLVLDIIEEDFRNETVAHVTGADRKAMMARKLAHIFRTTPYRTSRIVGRETTGRKDDRILLTGLTKPDVIEPWVSRILKNQVPLLSITSAAYVMELFAQSLKFGHAPHLLMVNQEANSGLRQTYLQKGRVIFSRLTPASVSESDDFSEFILEQCDQTRKYLERIKQLPYDTPLSIHVFTSEKFTNETSFDKEHLHFKYHVIPEMESSKRIDLAESSPGAIAYSLVGALRKKGVPNIYAPAKMRRYAFLKQIKDTMNLAGAIVALVSIIAVAPSILDTNSKWEQESLVIAQTAPLLAEYQSLTENFPETPIPSGQMELVVETADRIRSQLFRPNEMLAVISEALIAAPELQMASIEWALEGNQNDTAQQNFGFGESITDAQALQQVIIAGNADLVTTVRGFVQSEGSFREATALVNLFADTIAQDQSLQVTPLLMPMDASPDINVTTLIDGSGVRGSFALEIRKRRVDENETTL